jgi:CRP/FNR family cyclic AMP-dependent transcriptional regulator
VFVYDPAMTDIAELLASTPLFGAVSKKDLGKLAKDVHDRTFPAGTELSGEGEFGTIFTLVADGRATVQVDHVAVRSLGPGDFFGEMALIDGAHVRSATVTADTDVRALMLTQPAFRSFVKSHPETMWPLLELMVKRVREAEDRAG